jgi:hypothetical protein
MSQEIPRGNTEKHEIFRSKSLTNSATTSFSSEIPIGEGWYRLQLCFNLGITAGSESGAITEGELSYIKGIRIITDRGETIINNVPARALWYINALKTGSLGVKDAIATGTATKRVYIDLWFADPLGLKMQDTLLNTGRYRSIQLDVQLGSIADLFTTVGTAVVATTLDLVVERVKGIYPPELNKGIFNQYNLLTPIDPSVQTYVDIERASNRSYKRLYVFTTNSATAGLPCSGALTANTLLDFTLESDQKIYWKNILARLLSADNKQSYQQEAARTGVFLIDLANDGSLASSLYSGNFSRLKLNWTNDTLSTSQVTVVSECIADLV